MKLILNIVLASLLVSCNNSEDSKKSEKPNQKEVKTDTIKGNVEDIDSEQRNILEKSETDVYFSNKETKDHFSIVLYGKTLLDGEFEFKIENFEGEVLFSEIHPSISLLNYDIEADANDSSKEKFVRERINKFLNKDNFKTPAIGKEDSFDPDYSNEKNWNDIAAEPNSVSFHFLIGEEDWNSIAFSKNQNKVVVYFNCC